MSRLFPWISGDKSKQGARTGKTSERAADALSEASSIARSGDIRAATKLFEESIRIYQSLGLKQGEAEANRAFAVALASASSFAPAFEAFNISIALYRSLSQKAELAAVLKDAGQASADYSDSEQASAQLEESLSIYKSLGDAEGIAGTLQALGRAAIHDERSDEARSYYNQSLDIYKVLGQGDQEALCLAYLCSIAVSEDDFDAGRERYYASIDRYRSTPGASTMSDTLTELGAAPFADTSKSQIGELLSAAIAIYSHAQSSVGSESGSMGSALSTDVKLAYMPDSYGSDSAANQRAEAFACLILAPVAYSQERQDIALTLFRRSIDLAKGMSDANLLCHSLLHAGNISNRYYDLPSARKYYAMLKDAAISDGQEQYMASALYASASAAHQALDLESAVRDCVECLELYKAAGNISAVARTLMLYGEITDDRGDTEAGLKLLNESLDLCRHCDDPAGAAGALQCIGSVASTVDPVYARECLRECLDSDDADEWRISTALQTLAELELLEGEIGSAFEYCHRALSMRKELKDSLGIAASLELCGHIASIWGDIETAVILLSRSEATQLKIGIPRRPEVQERFDANLEKLKAEMGAGDFDKAWSEGTVLTLDEITDEVEQMLEDIEPEGEPADDLIDEEEEE